MERRKISAQQAFAILVTTSTTLNRKLADLADLAGELTPTSNLASVGTTSRA